jgi:hypothetical protein
MRFGSLPYNPRRVNQVMFKLYCEQQVLAALRETRVRASIADFLVARSNLLLSRLKENKNLLHEPAPTRNET